MILKGQIKIIIALIYAYNSGKIQCSYLRIFGGSQHVLFTLITLFMYSFSFLKFIDLINIH